MTLSDVSEGLVAADFVLLLNVCPASNSLLKN